MDRGRRKAGYVEEERRVRLGAITVNVDTGGWATARVVFGHETGPVEKTLYFANLATVDPKDARHQFLSRAREAERDIAFRMFGKDWREHVGPMWAKDLTRNEARLVRAVQQAWPSIFGEQEKEEA